MKKSISTLRKNKGFTLLELMVVIVILGIIASFVVPSLFGNVDKANAQKIVQDISTLETQLKMYKLDNYQYPTTEQGLEALVEASTIDPEPRNFPEEGYMPRLPEDPWGNEYQLLSPGENGIFDVFSMGPDGEAGTEDDIGNWNMREFAKGDTEQ